MPLALSSAIQDTIWGAAPWALTGQALFWGFRAISARIFPSYRKMKEADQAYWVSCMISTIHGVVISFSALRAFLEAEEKAAGMKDLMVFTDATTQCCHIILGYLFSDLLVCTWYHGHFVGNSLILVHHVLSMWFIGDICSHKYAHSLGMVTLMLEATAPFVNLRWFMAKNGMKDSHPNLYLFNGLAMLLSWFFVRICGCLWIGFWFLTVRDQVQELALIHRVNILVTYIVGFGLQLFWFAKILRGTIKALRKKFGTSPPPPPKKVD